MRIALYVCLGLLGFSNPALATYTAYNQLPYQEVENFTDAFVQGKPALFLRARVEHVDETSLPRGQANTLNTRLSFASASFQGFAGMIEFCNTTSYFNKRHNSGLPNEVSNRPAIPDPKGSSVLQSFLRYSGVPDTTFHFGRQIITLDNKRFVGDEPFRQTPKSFDAATVFNNSLPDTEIYYAYVSHYNNIFAGNDRSVGQNKLRSHLINGTWKPLEWIQWVAYSYLLNNRDVGADSSHTFGGRWLGTVTANDAISFDYLLEYARQHGRHNNPLRYKANYGNMAGGATYTSDNAFLNNIRLAAGYEIFQGDSTVSGKAFQTPLASNYAFNGQVGNFITKPAAGLKDLEILLEAKCMDYRLKVSRHLFRSQAQAMRIGVEWDFEMQYDANDYLKLSAIFGKFNATPASLMHNNNRLWLTAVVSI